MYKLINEDNSLVKEYPAPEIYRTISDEDKENLNIFKKEIEKITLEKGLGKVSVNVSYDGPTLQRAFIIKYSNGYSKEYYKKNLNEINKHMKLFSQENNLYDFFCNSYILIR
ncbi:MAG: hypothetical protein IJP12_03855 [Methanobrevibacter sp.]|nr:hypothetical protein [Methanobrevibacter sp.]